MTSFYTDAVAIHLIAAKEPKTFCFVYDLRNTNDLETWEYPEFIGTTNNCRMIFQNLVELYPPKMVKSICLKLNAAVEPDDRPTMAKLIKQIGKEFGYLNINWVSDFAASLTEDLIGKIHLDKYEVDDCTAFGLSDDDNARICLLRKQEIGWDILDCQKVCRADITLKNAFRLFIKNGIQLHQIKGMVKGKTSRLRADEEPRPSIDNACEYLSRVYSGEDYFNDYDCFLGNICEEQFWLKADKSAILFSTEYKRLPIIIQKKIKLVKCNKIQLTTSIDVSSNTPKEKVIYSESLKGITATVVVTLKVDENKDVYFKIEKDDAQRTLITTNVPLSEWTNGDRPTFTFGKNYVSVDYHKDGLSWKLKDANGAYQIPFKISFDKEIYVGSAALENSDFLMPDIDLEALSNVEDYPGLSSMFPDFILDDDKSYKILLKTKNALQKARPEILVAVFIKSVLKLLEEKLGKSVDEILVKYPNDSSTNSVISNACHFLKISHQNVTD